MKHQVAAVIATFFIANLALASTSCETRAEENKLTGAAKISFMKQCEEGAAAVAASACEAQANEKKLANAAKDTFIKQCVADATK